MIRIILTAKLTVLKILKIHLNNHIKFYSKDKNKIIYLIKMLILVLDFTLKLKRSNQNKSQNNHFCRA